MTTEKITIQRKFQTDPTPVVIGLEAGHTYGTGESTVVAVQRATFVVNSGDRIALMGPSGSGKSTLLHMMAGLEPVTSGRLEWPDTGASPEARRGLIGVIFQAPSLIPSLDVVQNVALPLVLAGMAQGVAEVEALEALDRLGLAGLAPKLPDELSGGQAQRVAIARVIAMRPRLILADEATGQLDQHSGQRVIEVLLDAADQLDAALVISTHDESIAALMPDHWRMRDGLLTAEIPATLPTTPRTPRKNGVTS